LIKHPASVLQSVTGGYLYHCAFCRIQFYDLRRQSRMREGAIIKRSLENSRSV
jgi:hypothetical protein